MSKKNLLTWACTPDLHEGSAGGVHLFTYTWAESKVHPGSPWVMHTALPGWSVRRWRSGSEIDLQEKAERMLARWLAKVAGEPVTVTIVLQDEENDLEGVQVRHDDELVWQENSVGDMDQYFRHYAPKGVPVILEVPEA